MKTSNDFFLAGRSIPGVDLRAGVHLREPRRAGSHRHGGASGAKYGIATSHFYWIGAIPAMVFVGMFMMPFYYGSKARSVPEYLRLRFDEKTRGAQRHLLCDDDGVFIGHLDVRDGEADPDAARVRRAFPGAGPGRERIFHVSIVLSALIVLGYIFLGGLTSAIYNEVLQFFLIVAGFLPLVLLGLKNVGGWSGLKAHAAPQRMSHAWRGMDARADQPDGRGVVRAGDGTGLCAVVRLLVHGLPGGPAGDGGGIDERRARARR